MDIERIIERMRTNGMDTAVMAYVALHAQSGCRISDLLAINHTSISRAGNISILQGKGSSALIVQPVFFREFWSDVKKHKLTPMEFYNRFYFYRLYRKFGIVYHKTNKKNAFVTHAFRKALADDIYNIDGNAKRVQGALGHRSATSTKHYTNE